MKTDDLINKLRETRDILRDEILNKKDAQTAPHKECCFDVGIQDGKCQCCGKSRGSSPQADKVGKAVYELSREIYCLKRERTLTDHGHGQIAGMRRAYAELTGDWKSTDSQIANIWMATKDSKLSGTEG